MQTVLDALLIGTMLPVTFDSACESICAESRSHDKAGNEITVGTVAITDNSVPTPTNKSISFHIKRYNLA